MGWQGSETTMPAGMLFAKMYCYKCASKLFKEEISRIFEKGEKGFAPQVLHKTMFGLGGIRMHGTIGMDEIKKSTYVYKCELCNYLITYEEQQKISKLQKELNKTILSDSDMKYLNISFTDEKSVKSQL